MVLLEENWRGEGERWVVAIEVQLHQYTLGQVKTFPLGVVERKWARNGKWPMSIVDRYHALSRSSESRLLLLEVCLRSNSLLLLLKVCLKNSGLLLLPLPEEDLLTSRLVSNVRGMLSAHELFCGNESGRLSLQV